MFAHKIAKRTSTDAACLSVYPKQLGGGGGECTPPPPKISTSTYGMKLKLTPEIPLDKRC